MGFFSKKAADSGVGIVGVVWRLEGDLECDRVDDGLELGAGRDTGGWSRRLSDAVKVVPGQVDGEWRCFDIQAERLLGAEVLLRAEDGPSVARGREYVPWVQSRRLPKCQSGVALSIKKNWRQN